MKTTSRVLLLLNAGVLVALCFVVTPPARAQQTPSFQETLKNAETRQKDWKAAASYWAGVVAENPSSNQC